MKYRDDILAEIATEITEEVQRGANPGPQYGTDLNAAKVILSPLDENDKDHTEDVEGTQLEIVYVEDDAVLDGSTTSKTQYITVLDYNRADVEATLANLEEIKTSLTGDSLSFDYQGYKRDTR